MGFFTRYVSDQQRDERLLGIPLRTVEARERRMNHFASLNPKGFRTPSKGIRKDAQGMTRRDRRLERNAKLMKPVSEDRPAKYMNSLPRRIDEVARLSERTDKLICLALDWAGKGRAG